MDRNEKLFVHLQRQVLNLQQQLQDIGNLLNEMQVNYVTVKKERDEAMEELNLINEESKETN